MATMNRNIPLSIDDELLAEIDRVVEATKESRSAVMRRAIREGLPVVEARGSADVISLDSETSKDATTACQELKVSRTRFLIESIRTGLQATYSRMMRDNWVRIQEQNPQDKEAEGMIRAYEHSTLMDNPMGREVRAAMRQRGAAIVRLSDIVQHVPEAWRRHQLVEKLTRIIQSPGGGGGYVWGAGLSTGEVEWQVNMAEKYGRTKPYPEHEIKSREEARKHEDRSHRDTVGQQFWKAYPQDWNP
jgi:predicted transcriptional regulator